MKNLKSLVPLLSLSTGWQTKIDFSVTFKFSSNFMVFKFFKLRFTPVQTSFWLGFPEKEL